MSKNMDFDALSEATKKLMDDISISDKEAQRALYLMHKSKYKEKFAELMGQFGEMLKEDKKVTTSCAIALMMECGELVIVNTIKTVAETHPETAKALGAQVVEKINTTIGVKK